MAITQSTKTILDGAGSNVIVKTLNDSSDSTTSPLHGVISGTGTTVDFSEGHGTAAAALRVELPTDGTGVVGLNAGTNMIGSTTVPGVVTKNPTVTVTAGAYTTGQVVGGLLTITNTFRTSGGSGTILNVGVSVKTALTAPFDVIFFGTNPSNSTFTDNASLAVNVADLPFIAGIVHCTDLVSLGTPQILQAYNVNIPVKNGSSNTSLYAVIVIRGAETFASTSALGLNVQFQQN
jgi:hypothetical protein